MCAVKFSCLFPLLQLFRLNVVKFPFLLNLHFLFHGPNAVPKIGKHHNFMLHTTCVPFYWVLLLNDNNTMWWYNNNISRRADNQIEHTAFIILHIQHFCKLVHTHSVSKHTAFSSTRSLFTSSALCVLLHEHHP